MVVAGVAFGAELAQLLGAYAAAAAAVEHQGDAGGAGGARPRSALALPAALLALSILQVPGGTEKEGGERQSRSRDSPDGAGAAGSSIYRAEESEQQGYGERGEGVADHPAAVRGLWVARRRRRAGSGVGLPSGEGSRGEPRASCRADLLDGADGAAAGAVPEGGCWVLRGSALLRSFRMRRESGCVTAECRTDAPL